MAINNFKTGPLLVTFAALLWAVDAPFRKFLTQDLSSTTIVFMEHILIAFLVLPLLWTRIGELKSLKWKEWLSVVFIALGGSALATIFFTQSFHYVSPTVAILLQKLQPLIAIALAALVLKENLSRKFWFWAVVAIAGAYLVSFPDLKITDLSLGSSLGVIFALLAAFFWGGSTVFGRFVLRKVSFQTMTALRFLGALFFLFLIQAWYGRLGEPLTVASSKDWLYVFIIAILAGYISLFIYYRGLRYTKASIATICELAFPLAAVVVNWIFLEATLQAGQIIGGVILLFAVTRLSLVNAEEPEKLTAVERESVV